MLSAVLFFYREVLRKEIEPILSPTPSGSAFPQIRRAPTQSGWIHLYLAADEEELARMLEVARMLFRRSRWE